VKYTVTIKGRSFDVEIVGGHARLDGLDVDASLHAVPGSPVRHLVLADRSESFAMVRQDGGWVLLRGGEVWEARVVDERTRALQAMTGRVGQPGGHVLKAPMPGLVLRLEVEAGTPVKAGQGLLVLEAMKMENELATPVAGRISAIHVVPGQAVDKGAPLLEVSAEG
jgi:biotin carboxyl carrier protein